MSLHIPWNPERPHVVGPKIAGWTYSGLTIVELRAGETFGLWTGPHEMFVLPLAGGVRVEADGEVADLEGRNSVFTRVTDFAYVGRDTMLTLSADRAAEIALPNAVCTEKRPPRYAPAGQVSVEVRGAGRSTRQVTNFGTPDGFPFAENLMACELITPPGNWSSYPPHKHDASDPCEVVNEEIYYYRIAAPDGRTPSREGFGFHRTYTGVEHADAGLDALDETITVRDGDIVLVPHGYHGPSVASPNYAMYYLNVLAGPGERSMAFCDDPEHTWIRDAWADEPLDPRCPVTSDEGRRP